MSILLQQSALFKAVHNTFSGVLLNRYTYGKAVDGATTVSIADPENPLKRKIEHKNVIVSISSLYI